MSSRISYAFFFVFLLLAGALGALYYVKGEWNPPTLSVTPDQSTAGASTVFTVTASDADSGLRLLHVTATQNGNTIDIVKRDLPEGTRDLTETFSLPKNISNGAVTLAVTVKDNSWHRLGHGNRADFKRDMTVDSKPPVVSVLSGQHNVNQGGTGLLVYSTDEELGRSGVRMGEHFFPGFPFQPGKYLCFFAIPYDADVKTLTPALVASDLAGNEVSIGFFFNPKTKAFKHDSINISDNFLQSKMGQFTQYFPDQTQPIDIFLKVNSELRAKNVAYLLQLGKDTVPQKLWDGPFIRLPNSAPMAGFADNRTYMHGGQAVDNQTHLGVDLASLATSPVPAGNTGRVVLAEFMGIYGNVVVLDHGFGIQSLYSHLSEIHVHKGETVQRGQIIGKTGATGMAGGDHLHFGMLVSGLEVQPIEWWDPHWIKDNITSKLQ
ncbi:M23 family metallopeptidase [Desulfomicrobium escambiense]|uniref:M23 family metallopeptidase n=1 Tax=Desulfomicrobium escambiense TaxID=29503 RepID=UPI000418048A|nr:M23 family metallopeptidase [Desulfomicrobium escambiense]